MSESLARRVGLWTASLDRVTLPELRDIASELDEQGWASLWFAEAFGRESLSTAALLLAASQRIHVGTGITSVYGRDSLTCAAAARTIHAQHPGRFILGLGVSHIPMVEQVRGHTYGQPLTIMRTYLQAIESSAAVVPDEQVLPPIVLAALGPRMLELAAEGAGGATTYLVLPEHTSRARAVLGSQARLVVEQAVVASRDATTHDWQQRAHAHLSRYTDLPNYRASFARQGFGDHDLANGGSEALMTAMVPFGVEAAARRVDEHFEAGADEVLLQVLGPSTASAPRRDWSHLAELLLGPRLYANQPISQGAIPCPTH
ncbi:MAG: TIGR03620 family F420-dependent LLM class oxidoreductase [Marmoricola sp.]